MCEQYLKEPDGSLSDGYIGAAEEALAILEEHGLIVFEHGNGQWTVKGKALLKSDIKRRLDNLPSAAEAPTRKAGEVASF